MADKDLSSIIDQLITALKAAAGDKYTSPTKSPSVKLSTEQGEVSKRVSELDFEELSKYLAEQENLTNKINKNIDTAERHAKETIDSEQIINELKEERISQIKQEFRQNQLVLLELRKQYDLIKEKNSEEAIDLDKKIKALQAQIIDQAKLLEGHEKEKKLKEGILSIGKEILQGAKQYTIELEKHIMNISKLNGGYAEFGSILREANLQIYQATAGSGIMFEEANAAFAGLSQNFIGLSTNSAKSIKDMATGAAQLAKVGVDIGSATKGFDSLVNAMGKTPQQAYKIQESFVNMAAKNRLALGSVSQAFAENSSRFVGYGEQMTKVLDGLAEQSLKTGISIGKLVGIAQGFDTFEDASKKVGNLNALLGGDYFNSVELLTASDEERIKLLKEGVAASGMQFESMNRFQKMAIANAAGITDLNEASKLFGQTSLQNTRQQEDAAKVQKTLAEQAESVSTSMDKMKSVINGVIIALDPLVSVLGWVAELLTAPAKWGKDIEGFGGKFLTVIGSVISLSLIWVSTNLLLGRGIVGLAKGLVSFISKIPQYIAALRAKKAAEDAAAITSPVTPAAGATSPAGPGKFMSFVSGINPVNLIAAAGAIAILAGAMVLLAKAFQEFGKVENPWQAFGLFAGGLLGLVIAAKVVSTNMGDVLLGALGIGIISLAVLALGIAISKFSGFDWKLVAGIGLIILGLGLAIAGFGLAVSGPQAVFIGLGIAMIIGIAGALLILGNSLEKVSTSFKTLSEIKNIAGLSVDLISFLDDLADAKIDPIKNLADAIGLLAENLQKLASVSANMSLNVTGNAKTVLNETVGAAASAVTKTADAVSSSAAARSSQTLIPAQQTTTFVPLIVQIDKKTIIEILQKDIESLARGQAENTLESVGIVQSAFQIQSRLAATPK
jgi:hypothetical protein